MRRWGQRLVWGVVVVVVAAGILLVATGMTAVILGPRARETTSRVFERTPARLERGAYLVTAVTGCLDCHSVRDWSQPGAPATPGREGAGSVWSDRGLPWLVAPNITSDTETGAGAWSDDVLARAIREGIGHDGRALFPLMPYLDYRQLSDEDVASIVVFVRTLAPVRNELPQTAMPFPLGLIMKTVPQPLDNPVPEPQRATPVARGEYLSTLAGCAVCHTPQRGGQPVESLRFAGGFELFEGDRRIVAPNITKDQTGIWFHTEATFIETMRTGRAGGRTLLSTMPWVFYRGMTDDDLAALFAYVTAQPAIRHLVDNSLPPTPCAVCGTPHGAGDKNVARR